MHESANIFKIGIAHVNQSAYMVWFVYVDENTQQSAFGEADCRAKTSNVFDQRERLFITFFRRFEFLIQCDDIDQS